MIKSISDLKIEFFKKEKGYKFYLLKKPLIVKLNNEKQFFVENGFITDLASIPKPINKIIKRNNPKYARSVIIHDYLYSIRVNRYKCDKIFLECMKYEETPFYYRYPMYFAVRLFGWIRYKR